jgi:sigma-B regulation protein RsbQ
MAANYQAWAVGFSKVIAANPDQPHVAESYAAFLKSLRPDIAHATLRMIFHSDMRPIVPRIAVPTLIVQASEDIAVPGEVARYLLAHIANAELREVAYAGHLPHMLAPKVVGDLLMEFLDGAIIAGHA